MIVKTNTLFSLVRQMNYNKMEIMGFPNIQRSAYYGKK